MAPGTMAMHRAIGEIVRSPHDDMGFHGRNAANSHCHPDPFGAAQGMLREGSHHMVQGAMAHSATAMIQGAESVR
jgi:hypothetical protein